MLFSSCQLRYNFISEPLLNVAVNKYLVFATNVVVQPIACSQLLFLQYILALDEEILHILKYFQLTFDEHLCSVLGDVVVNQKHTVYHQVHQVKSNEVHIDIALLPVKLAACVLQLHVA